MKKINFKWLLLSFILSIASINTAWATDTYIAGTFNGWSTSAYNLSSGTVSISLKASTTYEFKLVNNGAWTGNGQILNSNTKSVTISGSGKNCKIVTTDAGVYTFSLSGTTLSVTFPSPRTYKSGHKIYFKDHSSTMSTLGGNHWKSDGGNVYAKFYDGSKWTRSTYGNLVSGDWGDNNAVYEISVPGSDKTFTKVVFYRGSSSDNTSEWNLTMEQIPDLGQNLFTIADAKEGTEGWVGFWGKYAHNAALLGEFNDWDPCAGMFPTSSTIRVIVNLAASTSYRFTILKGSTYYACTTCAAISGTTENQQAYSGQNDFTLTTEEAGEYLFHWDNTNNRISVYYPKARLKKQSYIYFDARNSDASHWNQLSPIAARFYFKYYDSGVDQSNASVNTPLETSVLYTTVPNNDWIGKIQINRLSSNMGTQYDDKTSLMSASTRTNSGQNCLVIPAGQAAVWSPTVNWTTYCPIKETSTISDNGTVMTWGGSGTSGSPYYVAAGSKIKVSSASSDYVDDGNMTTKYDFQVRNTSDVQQAHSDGTVTTYEYTVPATNDVVYKVRVNAYNYYNSTSSTAKWSSDIYYKARTPYNIAYNKGSYGAEDNVTDVKLKGLNITLRGATFTRTGYTQTAWNTNSAGTGGTSYALSAIYTSDAAETLYPTWTAIETTITLKSNTSYHGSGEDKSAKVDYDATALKTITHTSAATGYHLVGYYTASTGGNKILEANGALVQNTTYTTNDATPKWKHYTGAITLWAHYEANTYTVVFNNNDSYYPGSASGEMSDQAFTYDAAQNLTANGFTLAGHSFAGWGTAAGTSAAAYSNGESVSNLTPTNGGEFPLYARWTEDTHSVSVVSGGNGSVSTSSVSGVGIATTSGDITATAVGGYYFIGWTLPDGVTPADGYTAASNPIRINATADSKTITANFAQKWVVSGDFLLDEYAAWDCNTNTIGNLALSSGDSVGYVDINLAAHTTYEFKIVERKFGAEYVWYGHTTEDVTLGYTDSETPKAFGYNYYNLSILTAGAGWYRFTWNMTDMELSVTYPTAYTVTYDDNGSTSGSVPTDAVYYGSGETVTAKTNSGTLAKTGYTFLGWNTQADGNGTDYDEDDTFTIAEDITLYAKWQNNTYVGKYTFHYGNSSTDTWTVVPFTQVGETEEWTISNFTIPDPSTYPDFYVGYEGWFVSSDLGSNHSRSRISTWDEEYTTTTHWGYMRTYPGYVKLSDGTKTGQGAVGTLHIKTNMSYPNVEVGFEPSGYGLTIYNGSTSRTVELKSLPNPVVFETDLFDGDELDALTAAEVGGSATYKVSLKTASGYVDSYQSVEWDVDALNANKLDYDTDISAGKNGRFQVWIDASNRDKENFSLRFTPLVNRATTSALGNWSSTSTWTLGHLPRINEDVLIDNGIMVKVDVADARAKSIRIGDGESTLSSLTINQTGALLVVEDIKAKHKDELAYGPTNEFDLIIKSDNTGNGALIVGNKSTDTEVGYHFYSRSFEYNTYGYINQYIGIPFASMYSYQFYGAYLFSYDDDNDEWKGGVSDMDPFRAYNLIQTLGSYNAFYLYGNLNLPGLGTSASDNVVMSCTARSDEWYEALSADDKLEKAKTDHLFANSWTAPLDMSAFEEEDFVNMEAALQIFNAGSKNKSSGKPDDLDANAGNYTAVTINDDKTPFIPGTSAFLVKTTGAAGTTSTLTLNYKKHVYDPALARLTAGNSISTTPTFAPRRERSEAEDYTRLNVIVYSDSAYADKLRIRERADFTNDFDNGWEASKTFGIDEAPQLYAINGSYWLTVAAVPDVEGMVIGFRKGSVEDTYTIAFDYDGDAELYLNDLKEQTSTLINDINEYTFTSDAEDAAARFVISANPILHVTTGMEEVMGEGLPATGTYKFILNDMLYIYRDGMLYDATGRLVK